MNKGDETILKIVVAGLALGFILGPAREWWL